MFIPPFCPQRDCSYHEDAHRQASSGGGRWFVRNGFYQTKAFGPVERYRCKACGRSFSHQTFRLDYYVKKPLDYLDLLEALNSGSGLRALGRKHKVSHHSIINRIGRLARQDLAITSELLHSERPKVEGGYVIDGFESFISDQWQPNNIHLLLGQSSQFLYDFDYAHLRRKGRMTEEQKEERERREKLLVRERVSIPASFARLLTSLEMQVEARLPLTTTLATDKKKEYGRELEKASYFKDVREKGRFLFKTYSSKLARTFNNPLFSANYIDRELRKNNAHYVRESVQFARSVNNCLERLAVFQLSHNYFKPYRIEHPEKKYLLHAERAGIPREKIREKLAALFEARRFYSHSRLTDSQDLVWRRGVGNVDRFDGGYLPRYIFM